jgi:transposase-like protein
VTQAEIDAGERPGLTTEEREELLRLHRENKRLPADVDLLKRATLYSFRGIHSGVFSPGFCRCR